MALTLARWPVADWPMRFVSFMLRERAMRMQVIRIVRGKTFD